MWCESNNITILGNACFIVISKLILGRNLGFFWVGARRESWIYWVGASRSLSLQREQDCMLLPSDNFHEYGC